MPNEPHYLDGLKQAIEQVKEEQKCKAEDEVQMRKWWAEKKKEDQANLLLFKPDNKVCIDTKNKEVCKDTAIDDISQLRQHWSG